MEKFTDNYSKNKTWLGVAILQGSPSLSASH